MSPKLNIEIWSDFACPFCYIGKRRFEEALARFEHRDQVAVRWRSFELDPERVATPGQSVHEMLAEKYGRSVEWAKSMNEQVTAQAKEAGVAFDIDRVVLANTFDAHRLAQLAAARGLQDQAEEKLFSAYFCEGKDLGEHETLAASAREIGLRADEVSSLLAGDAFAEQVRRDEQEARSLGIGGVPLFLFDRRFAVSGAQPVALFEKAFEKAWAERA